jgi:hypothetical protein
MDGAVRLLAFVTEGVAPCGRLLVGTGRVALLECSADEVAALPVSALVWSPGAPMPTGVPTLAPDEQDFVTSVGIGAVGGERSRDGLDWDSPGAEPPDAPA